MVEAQLRFGTQVVLGLQFQQLTLSPGLGACRLGLSYQLRLRHCPPGAVLQLAGELNRDGGGPAWLGTLQADRALPAFTDDQAGSLTFATSLSWDQLAALEEARAGDDLELRVDVHATLAGGAVDPPEHSRLATNQHQLRINRDEWARRLESVGASVWVPILVPLPIGDAGSRRGEAGRHLQTAMRAIADGRYQDAVREARMAIEIVQELDLEPDPKGIQRRQRTVAQRFAALREEAFSVASAAAHADTSYRFSRADAVALVGAAAGLLGRLR